MKPCKGERYISKLWLNPKDNSPLVHQITRVANGMVYYRADYGFHENGEQWLGSCAKFPIEQCEKWLGQKL